MVRVDIVSFVVFVLGSLFCLYVITASMLLYNAYDGACKDLGYSEYYKSSSPQTCEDIDGNLHYVKLDCTGLIFKSCTAKNIKVGDVTGIIK